MVERAHTIGTYLDKLAARTDLQRDEFLFAGLLVFAYLSGVQAHLLPAVFPFTRYTTDALLFFICVPLLYFLYRRGQDRRLLYWAFLTYVSTFFIEVAGVATGRIFGVYHYGPTMWIQWLNVPLVIALNWTLLILATNDLAARWVRSPFLAALVASILIAAYDFCIEPVAIALDYWQWATVSVPFQNYLAWSVVALVFSFPLQYFNIRFQSPLLLVYALAQLVFFLLLNLFL
ncbi:MAG: carotenoid biosynthesis protein [Bacteroidetes bacterium]|nr:MAG: carotenoid biosynthesis protein [Bacteroidota bacterium]PTM11624.1 MAG: carotenoid biosynthesis protein [Bacteroidota bacterium]